MKTVPIALLLLALLAPFGAACAASAATECALEYRFTAHRDATPRHFTVELLFDADGRTQTQVRIAREWAGVTDFERGVRDLRPGGDGITVSAGSEPEKTWKVTHAAAGRVSVKYDLLNDVANVDDDAPIPHRDFYRNMIGAAYFHFFGEGALIVPERLADDVAIPACLTFTGLAKGEAFASSHGEGQSGGIATIHAMLSPAALRSAVYLGGDFRVRRREIEGRPLYVALRGAWQFDDAKFVDMAATVVRAQRAFWDDYAFPYFLVSLLPNRVPSGSNGGTAIEHSFAMHAANDFTVPGPMFFTLLAHEHQHTWIPRRIGTMGGDEKEEARYYWFSEGFTDYLTHRVLLASGTWTLDDYAEALNGVIERYDGSPARNATNAVVLSDFWKDPNVERLPYMRGELIALRWSQALAARHHNLEATLRRLKRDHDWNEEEGARRPEDLAVNHVMSALREDLGEAVDRDMASLVERGDTVPRSPGFLGPCFTGQRVTRPRFELGFDSASFKTRTITGLVPGSAAEKAGLREGMAFAQGVETWEFHALPDAARQPDCKHWIATR